MSETKQTPLPWHATQDVGRRWHVDAGYRGPESDYVPVADIRNDGEGNSELIVNSVNASPKMKELCRAVREISSDTKKSFTAMPTKDEWYFIIRKAREVEAALGGKAE